MDWSGAPASIVGGVIGAIAGGVPAWLIARSQSRETLKRDREERTRQEKALAFSAQVKLFIIVNSTIHDWAHVHRSLGELADPRSAHMEPWQVVMPLVGQAGEQNIAMTPEELAFFLAAGENDFMHTILLLAQRHSAGQAAMKEYQVQRERMLELVPPPDEMEGLLGKAMITEEELRRLRPRGAALNSLVKQIADGLNDNIGLCREASNKLGPILTRYFNEGGPKGLSFPSPEELSAMLTAEQAA